MKRFLATALSIVGALGCLGTYAAEEAAQEAAAVKAAGWPMTAEEARRRQEIASAGKPERTIDLGDVKLELVLVPAGEFVIGSSDGPGATDALLKQTELLLADFLRKFPGRNEVAALQAEFAELKRSLSGPKPAPTSLEQVRKAAAFRRKVLLANPLLDFDSLLVVTTKYRNGHMSNRAIGCKMPLGGGMYLLKNFKTGSPEVVDLLKDCKIQNGRLAGKTLAGGEFGWPCLSYDGKQLLFAAVEPDFPQQSFKRTKTHSMNGPGVVVFKPEECFHIFKVNLDGTGLTQLTDGRWNDHGPAWLPNGRIVFSSERRVATNRCGRPLPLPTLHSMKADGSDLHWISRHETTQWAPSVDYDGRLVFTQWDYVDRGASIAHHIWSCYPDGSDPRSYHGNYPPSNNWNARPWAEYDVRAVPGSPGKYVATSSGHHSAMNGFPILIDINVEDDNKLSQVTPLTRFGTGQADLSGPFGPTWPLDKDYFLTSFNGDLILLDAVQDKGALWEPPRGMPGGEVVVEEAAGFNTEFLWKPHDGNRAAWVIPVQARPAPPVLPERTWQGERFAQADHQPATISIMNIYESDVTWPPGVVEKRQIKWLRIVQYFPKEFGPKGWPSMGRHEVKDGSPVTARMVLGVAPVEDDGSVYCQAPVGKAIYFQALDEEGMAIQNMRALTYVHPGEQMSCVGCHERKSRAGTSISTVPKALRRAPSPLEPEAGFLEPINFYRMVKPILDNKCVACHTENGKGPTDLSYDVLWEKGLQGRWGADVKKIKSGRSGNSRSIPGQGGARLSAMLAHLDPKHSKGRLTPQEVRRLIMWMDCQSNEYGASVELARQRQGDLIWPHGQQDPDPSIFRPLDVDPWNPAGIEVLPIVDRTVPGPITNLKAEPSTLHPFPIVLSWDPAPGVGSGLGAYAVYRDGELRTWLTGNSYADYTADPAKSHTYEIVPINRSGLAGPKSAAVQAATLPLARSTLRQN